MSYATLAADARRFARDCRLELQRARQRDAAQEHLDSLAEAAEDAESAAKDFERLGALPKG